MRRKASSLLLSFCSSQSPPPSYLFPHPLRETSGPRRRQRSHSRWRTRRRLVLSCLRGARRGSRRRGARCRRCRRMSVQRRRRRRRRIEERLPLERRRGPALPLSEAASQRCRRAAAPFPVRRREWWPRRVRQLRRVVRHFLTGFSWWKRKRKKKKKSDFFFLPLVSSVKTEKKKKTPLSLSLSTRPPRSASSPRPPPS